MRESIKHGPFVGGFFRRGVPTLQRNQGGARRKMLGGGCKMPDESDKNSLALEGRARIFQQEHGRG